MAKKKKTKTKTRQPSARQTDRDSHGRFVEGNNAGVQFPPGQSGNPNGPPKRRVNLWVWFCKYMGMTDDELKKLDLTELTQAQQAALKLVENIKEGKGSGSESLARHVFDRDEGRPIEHIVIGEEDVLSDQECEEIRQTLLDKNNGNVTEQ